MPTFILLASREATSSRLFRPQHEPTPRKPSWPQDGGNHRTDVPPTSNHAEQQLRGGVIWRKTSGGSQSDRGDRFVDRLLTVVHSLRKQHRYVLSSLVEAVSNARRGLPAPSLLPGSVSAA